MQAQPEIGAADEDVIAAATDTSNLETRDAGLPGVGPAGFPEKVNSNR